MAATNIEKECTYIEIEDSGIFSDYEMSSKEKIRALASPLKNGVHTAISVFK